MDYALIVLYALTLCKLKFIIGSGVGHHISIFYDKRILKIVIKKIQIYSPKKTKGNF